MKQTRLEPNYIQSREQIKEEEEKRSLMELLFPESQTGSAV